MSGASTPNLTAAASRSSSPQSHGPHRGSASHAVASSSSSAPAGQGTSTTKKGGIFSSDGSFIERFQKLQEDQVEKRKAEEARTKAKEQADRIKNRGRKRPSESKDSTEEASKKPKTQSASDKTADHSESAYLKEVRKLQAGTSRDEGSGVKPLMH